MEEQLYKALKYAYELLLDQAETGHYPVKALAENGGQGYEQIQTAIKACESQKADDQGNCIKPAVSSSFCNCPTLKEELHYSYCVPVCFKCNKVVQLQND